MTASALTLRSVTRLPERCGVQTGGPGLLRRDLRRFEAVTEPPQRGEKHGLVRLFFDLFAQAADMDIHRSRSDEMLLAPHLLEKLLPREGVAGMEDEEFQQLVLR